MSRRAARELRRRVPSEVRETLGWAGFAAVVALGVIAASDHGLAAAAMWALGLLAIAAVAVVTLKLTGMRLDHLHRRRHG